MKKNGLKYLVSIVLCLSIVFSQSAILTNAATTTNVSVNSTTVKSLVKKFNSSYFNSYTFPKSYKKGDSVSFAVYSALCMLTSKSIDYDDLPAELKSGYAGAVKTSLLTTYLKNLFGSNAKIAKVYDFKGMLPFKYSKKHDIYYWPGFGGGSGMEMKAMSCKKSGYSYTVSAVLYQNHGEYDYIAYKALGYSKEYSSKSALLKDIKKFPRYEITFYKKGSTLNITKILKK